MAVSFPPQTLVVVAQGRKVGRTLYVYLKVFDAAVPAR
jgi:hypothetical protein